MTGSEHSNEREKLPNPLPIFNLSFRCNLITSGASILPLQRNPSTKNEKIQNFRNSILPLSGKTRNTVHHMILRYRPQIFMSNKVLENHENSELEALSFSYLHLHQHTISLCLIYLR